MQSDVKLSIILKKQKYNLLLVILKIIFFFNIFIKISNIFLINI